MLRRYDIKSDWSDVVGGEPEVITKCLSSDLVVHLTSWRMTVSFSKPKAVCQLDKFRRHWTSVLIAYTWL